MADLAECTVAVNNIQSLDESPPETAAELQILLDKTGADLKNWINATLRVHINSNLQSKITGNTTVPDNADGSNGDVYLMYLT